MNAARCSKKLMCKALAAAASLGLLATACACGCAAAHTLMSAGMHADQVAAVSTKLTVVSSATLLVSARSHCRSIVLKPQSKWKQPSIPADQRQSGTQQLSQLASQPPITDHYLNPGHCLVEHLKLPTPLSSNPDPDQSRCQQHQHLCMHLAPLAITFTWPRKFPESWLMQAA